MYFHVSVYTIYMSIITQNGMSALHLAAGMGWTDVVVELVKNGANLNLQNIVYMSLHTYMYNNACEFSTPNHSKPEYFSSTIVYRFSTRFGHHSILSRI